MVRDAHGASNERVEAYYKIVSTSGTTLYDAIQALVLLKDQDISLIGRTRADMVAELLEKYPVGDAK